MKAVPFNYKILQFISKEHTKPRKISFFLFLVLFEISILIFHLKCFLSFIYSITKNDIQYLKPNNTFYKNLFNIYI